MSQNEEERSGKANQHDAAKDDAKGFDADDRQTPEPAQGAEAADQSSAEPGAAPERESGEDHDNSADGNATANDEVMRLREAMLRLKAEMDNREKRLEREMSKSRKFAVERLVRDLIPVLDSMDQALTAEPSSEGMELTRKQALKVLSEHGLEALDPLGERFDPTWHEAIATQPSDSDADDTVLQVLQKGYRLSERLVRPARVIVAKAS